MRISQHDLDVRVEQAEKFLKRGDKLRIDLMLKGREKQYPEKAAGMIRDFVESIKAKGGLNIEIEQDLTKMGGRFNMVVFNRND